MVLLRLSTIYQHPLTLPSSAAVQPSAELLSLCSSQYEESELKSWCCQPGPVCAMADFFARGVHAAAPDRVPHTQ